MEELILIATIITIVSIIRKSKKKRQATKQTVTKQTIPIIPGTDFTKLIKAEQKEKEKLIKEDLKRSEQLRTAKQKARIAYNDIAHLKQQQTDYLKVYTYYESVYNDPDKSDKTRQVAYLKKISLDNKIRTINRNIEQAQVKIDNYSRLVKS